MPVGLYKCSGATIRHYHDRLFIKDSSIPVKSYTLKFIIKKIICKFSLFDESIYANKIANHLNTNHTEVILKQNLIEIIPKIGEVFSEPFSDASQ